MASKSLLLRRLSRALKPPSPPSSVPLRTATLHLLPQASDSLQNIRGPRFSSASRSFCSRSLNHNDDAQGPAAIDYSSILQEDEFHNLADSTLNELQEKIEEYGDSVQIDGFDIDYGNEVLTLKLGDLGTYVLNKQTPNRQIWLSSPVSGPLRFDWDGNAQAWVYRRTKANLSKVLESELEQLCGEAINLS